MHEAHQGIVELARQAQSAAIAGNERDVERSATRILTELAIHLDDERLTMIKLDTIEEALVEKFPTVRVLDRWVVSRTPKRLGHVIGQDGRRSGFVPVPFTESGA